MSRHVAIVALVAAASFTACSVEQSLPPPRCSDGGSALIVAQSVSSASQIPCLDSLPEGWSISAVQVDQNGTVVTLDSDRAGNAAATLNLQPTCDLSGSVSSPSDLEGGERYDRIDQLEPSFKATRFYVFPGGCLWWEFDFRKGASATESVAIGEVLYLVPRDEVNAELRKHFIDADL